MKFVVITLAPTLLKEDQRYHSYAPYVREMDLWFSNVDEVTLVSPTRYDTVFLSAPFQRNDIKVVSIPWLTFNSVYGILKSLIRLPVLYWKLFREMRRADHIHLRCPGNIGLFASTVQIFFPKKIKTVKYAGNWDPNAQQPLSYRIQKAILSNTFLTKKMKVLVYGDWPDQTQNIKSFFTATYAKSKVPALRSGSFLPPFKFLFVGSLSPGKRPLYVVRLIEALYKEGFDVQIDFYGDGTQRNILESYIRDKHLESIVRLLGNQPAKKVETAYRESHFLLLPSKSEGWPKVVAEAMFWGCIPMVTKISCVPWMLANGKRGVLLEANLEEDLLEITKILSKPDQLMKQQIQAQKWSHQYTIDSFESEIKKIVS